MSVVAWLITGMTLLYPLAMFRGLEPNSGYWGNAYQAIHPESFPVDPYMSPTRPTMVSVLYLIVKAFGELWLDDRVAIIIYGCLTAIALVGIDKTARLLGAKRTSERVAILSLMLLGHEIIGASHAFAIDVIDFNPTVFAAPATIWLLYAGLAGSRPRLVIPLMLLVPLISMKNAAMTLLVALTLFWKDRLGARGRIVAGVAACGLLLGACAVYYALIRPPDGSHAWIFDHLIQDDKGGANPWLQPLAKNLMFVAICVAGLIMRGLDAAVMARVRVVAALGLLVWAGGGLYLSYAPDVLKIPYLVTFHPARMLWWAQYVLYLAFGVSLLKWLQRTRSWVGLGVAWASLMTLYLIHNTLHTKLALTVIGTTALLWGIFRVRGGVAAMRPEWRVRIVAAAMCVGTLSLYGVGTLHHRLGALRHLARHGIMGDNGGAKWVGVNEYVREHTPASATFLAITVHRDGALGYDGSLRVRTGRSMVFGHSVTMYFDAKKLRWWDEQQRRINALVEAWKRRDAGEVLHYLSLYHPLDYLVVDTTRSGWLLERPDLPFTVETMIGPFAILRRVP